jgi:predicted enzyme related to lactoylglutathione lyase
MSGVASTNQEDVVPSKMSLVVYPVQDLARAKDLFTSLLGTEPYVDAPYYVGYRVDGAEIGLNPRPSGPGGPIPYFDVSDLGATIDSLTGNGATVAQEPTDVGGGLLVALLTDVDGNPVGLRQAAG